MSPTFPHCFHVSSKPFVSRPQGQVKLLGLEFMALQEWVQPALQLPAHSCVPVLLQDHQSTSQLPARLIQPRPLGPTPEFPLGRLGVGLGNFHSPPISTGCWCWSWDRTLSTAPLYELPFPVSVLFCASSSDPYLTHLSKLLQMPPPPWGPPGLLQQSV